MQWSKLKSRVKNFICPELKERIDFHLTSYRKSHDGADKVWITLDGQRVFTCKHYQYVWAEYDVYSIGLRDDAAKAVLRKAEIHDPGDFGSAIRAYLDMPIQEALSSAHPLIKAFAVIDRRVGKRTIEKLKPVENDHSLVKTFYQARCSCLRI